MHQEDLGAGVYWSRRVWEQDDMVTGEMGAVGKARRIWEYNDIRTGGYKSRRI